MFLYFFFMVPCAVLFFCCLNVIFGYGSRKKLSPRAMACYAIAVALWPIALSLGVVAFLVYFTIAVFKNNWTWPSKYLSK